MTAHTPEPYFRVSQPERSMPRYAHMYSVQGLKGELQSSHPTLQGANCEAMRLNKAYALGGGGLNPAAYREVVEALQANQRVQEHTCTRCYPDSPCEEYKTLSENAYELTKTALTAATGGQG